MLQEEEKNEDSLLYLMHSHHHCESIYGPQSIQVASASHALATCLNFSGNAKDAFPYETRNYQILKSILGEQDMRTMQAKILMKQLTETAVQYAKDQNAAKPVKAILTNSPSIDASQTAQNGLSDLSVNEVMKWISDNSRSVTEIQSLSSGNGLASNKLRPNRAWGTTQQPTTPPTQPKTAAQNKPQPTQATKTQTATIQAPSEQKPHAKRGGRGGRGRSKK